jgi:putative FmdB family regulatory protein
MPIYAYRCEACGHAKDVLQKLSDPVLTVCPACGAEAFRKQLTAAGFQLKGSGWYVTDFRDGHKAKPDGPAAKPGEAGESSAPKPAESPAAPGSQDAAAPAPAAAPASSPAGAPAASPAATKPGGTPPGA